MHKNKDISPNESTLGQFIEDNHKVLSMLGIFTGLSVFSSNLVLKPLGGFLSFLFLTLTLLIWLEVWQRFPSKSGSARLSLFENVLAVTILLVFFYWLVEFRRIAPSEGLTMIITLVTLWVVSSILKRFNVFNRLFHAQPGKLKWLRSIFGIILISGVLYASSRTARVLWHLLLVDSSTLPCKNCRELASKARELSKRE